MKTEILSFYFAYNANLLHFHFFCLEHSSLRHLLQKDLELDDERKYLKNFCFESWSPARDSWADPLHSPVSGVVLNAIINFVIYLFCFWFCCSGPCIDFWISSDFWFFFFLVFLTFPSSFISSDFPFLSSSYLRTSLLSPLSSPSSTCSMQLFHECLFCLFVSLFCGLPVRKEQRQPRLNWHGKSGSL